MDLTQLAVTAGGTGLIGLTLWFFFGKGAQPGSKGGAGRYTCPMHPWIASCDPAADCSICGMKLVDSK
jgi:hypothetical protein